MKDAIMLLQELRYDLHWDSIGIKTHVSTEKNPHKISEEEFHHYLHEVERRLFEIQRLIEG